MNRLVRTRLPGGVGGGIRKDSLYPDSTAYFSTFYLSSSTTQIITVLNIFYSETSIKLFLKLTLQLLHTCGPG